MDRQRWTRVFLDEVLVKSKKRHLNLPDSTWPRDVDYCRKPDFDSNSCCHSSNLLP